MRFVDDDTMACFPGADPEVVVVEAVSNTG